MKDETSENELIIDELSERISNCIDIIWLYGHLKNKNHKSWVIDQVLRNLIGNEDDYNEWIKKYEFDEETKTKYKWDFGTEPE